MSLLKNNNRYDRQIRLKEFGQTAQDKLNRAKVLVIGAGGLGCPALQYLASAGVGTIGIVDFDRVELSNLQRQILFNMEDIGKPKAETAATKIKAMNPEIQVHVYSFKITNQNALDIIVEYDIVIDGSDDFTTRYLVNDACVLLNKHLVYGAVLRFEGQIGVFNVANLSTGTKSNYRDLFPVPPASQSHISCNDLGVLGVVPGIIGTMQAAEAIKILTNIGNPLSNKILTYDVLKNEFYEFQITENNGHSHLMPKDRIEFQAYNYEWFCSTHEPSLEINSTEFNQMRLNEVLTILDVREMYEQPVELEFPVIRIPLSRWEEDLHMISTKHTIVVVCQSGVRSLAAVKKLKILFLDQNIYSLQGGIHAFKNNDKLNLL
ncbi:MAG: molybdopterin-synthase adenylyltransferase MoeB [Saprospiraceae bacterium]|nr:molybdopterin-synthase adenylyltransferase MoeB [Candidatus Defluviibacterium haderslevense]